MPRGNDPTPAHELADAFGQGDGNAEELIQAAQAMHTRELAEAERLPVNVEATQALDLDKLETPEKGQLVHDAAVRGRFVVVAYDIGDGRVALHAYENPDHVAKANSGPRRPDAANLKAKEPPEPDGK